MKLGVVVKVRGYMNFHVDFASLHIKRDVINLSNI